MPVDAVRLGREGLARAGNVLTYRRFAQQVAARGAPPAGGIAVFFATVPGNLYQLEQWRRPLERLAASCPVFVVVDRPDTGRAVLRSTSLPVAYARGSAALERLVAERDVRLVLYLNQVEANFRMLRFPGPLHIQIGHGESDKDGSVSNQHKAYDLTFVAGAAGRDRLGAALRDFDADRRTVPVGRPQLDYDYPGAPDWPAGSGLRVWYAPTWEGDRPSIAYGSLASHGMAIVAALLADPTVRVIYRPHPRIGAASASHAAADRAIRTRLRTAGRRHLTDDGEYGWQWAFADACVTDISAVAYDWLATGKPLVVTEPAERRVFRPSSPLLDRLPLLAAGEADGVLEWLRARGLGAAATAEPADLAGLTRYYFGDVTRGASTRRFGEAVDKALARAR